MNTIKKWSLLIVALITMMALAACSDDTSAGEGGSTTITMPLGGTSGTFYIQGAALADDLNSKTDKFRIIPSTSGGSVENIRLVGSGEGDMGMAFSGDLYNAWLGEGTFENELQEYRQVGPAQQLSGWNFIVLADSGIESVEDLAGKNFSPGAPGSGSASDADLFFEEIGLTDEFNAVYNAWGELPEMLKNNDIVGFNRTGGIPTPVAQEIDLTHPMKILDLKPQMDEVNFLEKYPYFSEFKIPAETYEGQEEDAITFGQDVKWIAHEDVPDEVIYEFLELAYTDEAVESLDGVYPDHNHRPEDEAILDVIVPYHPGAQQYWEDQGYEFSDPPLVEEE